MSVMRVHAVVMLEEPLLGSVEGGRKKQSVETMLRVVQHLRLQQRPSSGYKVMFSNRLSYTWLCNAGAAYTRTYTLYIVFVNRRSKSTVWENNFWLELDYLQLAQAALSCSSYFSTILYAEIWCSVQR